MRPRLLLVRLRYRIFFFVDDLDCASWGVRWQSCGTLRWRCDLTSLVVNELALEKRVEVPLLLRLISNQIHIYLLIAAYEVFLLLLWLIKDVNACRACVGCLEHLVWSADHWAGYLAVDLLDLFESRYVLRRDIPVVHEWVLSKLDTGLKVRKVSATVFKRVLLVSIPPLMTA